MSRPFIVVGDKTSHGGTVVTGAPASITHGKQVARIGDRVTCPRRHHHPNSIVTGDSSMIVMGRPVARHGDKTACGATLISGQSATTAESGTDNEDQRRPESRDPNPTATLSESSPKQSHPTDSQRSTGNYVE